MAVKNISPKSESCKPQFTAKRARELFHYEPETGIFRRKIQRSHNACVGDIAGSLTDEGRRIIEVGEGKTRKVYKAHRLAWLYMTGEFPNHRIDHANGNPSDNRWDNLRLATASESSANTKMIRSNNTSGWRWVSWDKQMNKWRWGVQANRKKTQGLSDCPAAAYLNAVVASDKLHGDFSPIHRKG